MKYFIVISYYSGTDCIGYIPAPFSTRALNTNKISEGGNNQNDMLLSLGKAISGLPQCTGNK